METYKILFIAAWTSAVVPLVVAGWHFFQIKKDPERNKWRMGIMLFVFILGFVSLNVFNHFAGVEQEKFLSENSMDLK